MDINLTESISTACFAFRGYNVTNLGRTGELLAHPAYGTIVRKCLHDASELASETTGRRVNLIRRVQRGQETTLRTFADAIALIMAVEVAQVRILDEFFGIRYAEAEMAVGYSLGELSAIVCSDIFTMEDALRVPLTMADDCAALGRSTHMGIVFSRGPALDTDAIRRLCLDINAEGHGVVAISAYLSPNTLLLLGQRRTIDRFKKLKAGRLADNVHLRKSSSHWPPLHTPIVWERNISNRAGVLMHTLGGGFGRPKPPIVSLVTGKASYKESNCRALLGRWIDHPQRVWDTVYTMLSEGVETVIHVGPEPNLFPATFKRLSDNVQLQLSGSSPSSLGLRMVSGIARRPWLTSILPSRTALLRAPFIQHVILEDWLLEQNVS